MTIKRLRMVLLPSTSPSGQPHLFLIVLTSLKICLPWSFPCQTHQPPTSPNWNTPTRRSFDSFSSSGNFFARYTSCSILGSIQPFEKDMQICNQKQLKFNCVSHLAQNFLLLSLSGISGDDLLSACLLSCPPLTLIGGAEEDEVQGEEEAVRARLHDG